MTVLRLETDSNGNHLKAQTVCDGDKKMVAVEFFVNDELKAVHEYGYDEPLINIFIEIEKQFEKLL